MKKLVILLFAVMLAGQAWAQNFAIGKLLYTVTDATNNYVSVSRASNTDTPSGDLVIPESVTDPEASGEPYTVTSIANYAFHSCANITSVSIPSTVTSIGMQAFYNCTSLTTVSIPSSITEISFDVFEGCVSLAAINIAEGNANYASIDGVLFNNDKTELLYYPASKTGSSYSIPGTVTKIGSSAFENCSNLTSITIPNTVVTIQYDAFYNCSNLVSITIPESVFNLGNSVFYGCSKLTEINVASGNSNYSSEDGVLFNKAKTKLICYPASKASSAYTVPESVTTIDESAFYGCGNLKSVVIPNAETSLEDGVFQNCASLESVTLPNSITEIPAVAFGGCTSLTSIEIPNTVTYIGNSAFSGSGLTSIEIPESVKEIASYAFKECDGLETITIPATVEKVQSWVFQGCDNLTINCCATIIPSGWSTYWNYNNIPYNLGSCGGKMWTVNLSANNSSYGSVSGGGTFADGSTITITATPSDGCSFVKWSNGLTTATANITVTSDTTLVASFAPITITFSYYFSSDTTIAIDKSDDYKDLTEVVIPDTVEINGRKYAVNCISFYAFEDCVDLTSVTIPNTIENILGGAFFGCANLTSINIPNSVTNIGHATFWGCSSIKSLTLPNSITDIGYTAFYDCSNLTSINIPEGVAAIEESTFYGCNSLASVSIPESLTSVGRCAFYDCKNLTSINIPESVADIGEYAFSGCENLTSITIPDGVTSIGDGTFMGCKKLTSIYIPESVTTIGYGAFQGCENLTSITIPQSVTHIGRSAFDGCSSLVWMKIPDSVESIGEYAFYECENLSLITIPKSVKTIENDVFINCNDLTIYCEAESQPVGWNEDWNYNYKDIPVVWNAGENLEIFKVLAAADNNAYGSVEGVGAAVGGYTTTITAKPANGYHFTNWSDNNTDNPRTLTITSDTTLTALFEKHTTVVDDAVAATCTKSGKTEGSHCSVCGEVIVAQKTIPALGHKFVNYIYNNDATTETDGTETAVCEHGCGETDTRVAEGTKLNTAVSESTASAVNIYAAGNIIVVENATDEICIYDAMGKLVCRDAINRVRTEITVNIPGVYIVKTGSTVKRVMVN